MITRPLDLASKLRPDPRNFDWLFFVNAGLIGLFFSLFGSRFVLAPGLGVQFQLPEVAGATANARATTHTITVVNASLILVNDGSRKLNELPRWLSEQKNGESAPTLLVRANQNVPMSVILEIGSMARAAGFTVLAAADEPGMAEAKRGGR
jgi:biopolymer transport protein ExbD